MSWIGQNPPENDLLAVIANTEEGIYIHVDQPKRGVFRATMGNLFNAMELARATDLPELLRRCNSFKYARGERELIRARGHIMALGGAKALNEGT